jgi:hypothetical protein
MTMPRALDNLLAECLSDAVTCLPSPVAVRYSLLRSPEVAEIRQALRTGELVDEDIRHFVNQLMRDFQKGVRFCHEAALCAISVALERRETSFAAEYTNDLAKLQLAELSTAIRVAKQSAEARKRLASNERSRTVLTEPVQRFVFVPLVRLTNSKMRTQSRMLIISGN